jgi:hypothetical protein
MFERILCLGVWYGTHKPNLERDGFKLKTGEAEPIHVKAKLLNGILDGQAKPPVTGCPAPNARKTLTACPTCLVVPQSRGNTIFFPWVKQVDIKLRNSNFFYFVSHIRSC